MERKELFEFFSQTSFDRCVTREKSHKRLEIDAGQFVTVALKERNVKDYQIEDHLWGNVMK